MAVREIVLLGNPLLRTAASPVGDPASPEIARLIDDLRDTLADCRARTTYGRAIAAPQVGELLRVVFLNVDRPWPLINPSIVARSAETMLLWDACLSYLSIFFQVERNRWIVVRYQDAQGDWHEAKVEGDLSELLQHEIDHLDGVLAIDRVTDVKTICTREEFERRHRAESPYAS
jgi:peptide deformylase